MDYGIFWLASYPKSGNTWVRTVITNYLLDEETPADINNLKTDSIASNRAIFDEVLNIASSDMNENEISLYQPLIYEGLVKDIKKNLYIKVHDAYTFNTNKKPVFSSSATKGVLYIVRNPLDIVVSYSHHNAQNPNVTIENLNDRNFNCIKDKKRITTSTSAKNVKLVCAY